MEIALIIAIVLVISVLGYVIYKLLGIIEKFAKLIKADNLQEYENVEGKPETEIEVGQTEKRFQDISDISDEDLKNIKINPESIYTGFTGSKTKTEKFTS